ncbi:hypothetical protein AB0C52_27965 [Streptomyces sp. NPDC048717]|uniref:hypothetical protein n=1 Tax=Streptomyces sp. NPDC048717 TaxID=3154928 RepID=UPI003423307A
MARSIADAGRVTLFPLLHTWPDVYGMVAYTTTGHFGDTAVMGYIPIPEVPDVSLLDVAARHLTVNADRAACASWALCTGWSARLVKKVGTLDLADTKWELEIDATTAPKEQVYGHNRLHVGRFSMPDDELMDRARTLLPALAG